MFPKILSGEKHGNDLTLWVSKTAAFSASFRGTMKVPTGGVVTWGFLSAGVVWSRVRLLRIEAKRKK